MLEAGINNLRCAILRQAVQDYIKALKRNDVARADSLERFFKSDWGEWLSDHRGDYIIEECKRRARNNETYF